MWESVMLCTESSSSDSQNSTVDCVMGWSGAYGLCDGLIRTLWARIKGKANTGNIVVGICYRSPGQEGETDEACSGQVEDASLFQAPAFVGYTNWPDIHWAGDSVGHKQSRFLEWVRDNLLTQVLDRLNRGKFGLTSCSQTRKKWWGLWWLIAILERPRGGRI